MFVCLSFEDDRAVRNLELVCTKSRMVAHPANKIQLDCVIIAPAFPHDQLPHQHQPHQQMRLPSIIRYLPLSNPRFQLVAFLALHTRYRTGIPMDTLISTLPGIDPPSPRTRRPTPPPHVNPPKREKKSQKERRRNVTKFVNQPPDPLYYFEDGLRKVHPYYFTFNTFCKERWRGMTLLEVFSSEFRDRPVEYYVGSPFCPPTPSHARKTEGIGGADGRREMPSRRAPSTSQARTGARCLPRRRGQALTRSSRTAT